jgi:hypothetical protein
LHFEKVAFVAGVILNKKKISVFDSTFCYEEKVQLSLSLLYLTDLLQRATNAASAKY